MAKVITTELQHSGASGANITLDSSKNVTCENNLTVDGTTTLTGAVTGTPLSFRNLIVNGAMQVAQRGTSFTTDGYTVDHFAHKYAAEDEMSTHAQVTLTSSDTGPWEKGFRKAVQITNGDQTSGAGAGDYARTHVKIEAQDLASSGWEYTSTSSNITFSFWVKSSVAQTFHAFWQTQDGTQQQYPFSYALSANTWTKVVKTIPGNSNIQIDSNADAGMTLYMYMFAGTNFTDAGVTLNAWGAYNSSAQTPNDTSTWYTTNDATFSYTGFQLEVGDTATEFEHRSYGDELARCQRYYYQFAALSNNYMPSVGSTARSRFFISHPVTMRDSPTATMSNYTIETNTVGMSAYESNDQTNVLFACTVAAEL